MANKQITIFSTPGRIPELINNDKLLTKELLNISKTVVIVVECFGNVFKPVVNDLNGNIKKITIKYEEDEDKHKYIEDMIVLAKQEQQFVVIDALKWLRRGLQFVAKLFELILNDTKNSLNLTPLFRKAYEETLQIYHGWFGRQLFKIVSQCTPNRRQLFYILALEQNDRDCHVLEDMKIFTNQLKCSTDKLVLFYQQNKLEN